MNRWRGFRFWQNSVMLTWLISYVIVFFCPVLISVIVYSKSNRMIHDEIQRSNQALVAQVQEMMDNQIGILKTFSENIVWNDFVRNLMYSNLSHSEQLYAAYQVQRSMLSYKTINPSIDSFYVYWADNNELLMPGAGTTGELTDQTFSQINSRLNHTQWQQLLSAYNYKGFLLDSKDSKSHHLIYLETMPADSRGRIPGAVIVTINADRMLQAIQNVELYNKGTMLILNKNNEILVSSSGQNGETLPSAFSVSSGQGVFHGTDSKFFSVPSNVDPSLSYLSIIPKDQLWRKDNYLQIYIWLALTASGLIGTLLIYFFLRRNYRPLRNLVLSLGQDWKREGNNEFNYLSRVFSDTLNKKEWLELRLKQQQRLLRSNLLNRLLKKSMLSNVSIPDSLGALDIHFEYEAFAIILVYLENTNQYYQFMNGVDSESRVRLLPFLITNTFEELARSRHVGYVTEMDDTLVCIVNLQPDTKNQQAQDILSIALEASEFLKKHYRIELTLSVSGIHKGIAAIPIAYREALDAMEYKLIIGKKEIIAYEDMVKETKVGTDIGYDYPLQEESRLMNCMKTGNFEEATALLKNVLERNLKRKHVAVPVVKCLIFNLISTMIQTMNESGLVEESQMFSSTEWMDRIIKSETVDEMRDQLLAVMRDVCQLTADQMKRNSDKIRFENIKELVNEVELFIDNHYHEFNLNVTMVGEHFKLKPTYLSRLFKEHTGKSLLDSINQTRIEKAKTKLISEPDVNISTVAAAVGFTDSASFIRMFKKYEGITPGKYRDLRIQDSQPI